MTPSRSATLPVKITVAAALALLLLVLPMFRGISPLDTAAFLAQFVVDLTRAAWTLVVTAFQAVYEFVVA